MKMLRILQVTIDPMWLIFWVTHLWNSRTYTRMPHLKYILSKSTTFQISKSLPDILKFEKFCRAIKKEIKNVNTCRFLKGIRHQNTRQLLRSMNFRNSIYATDYDEDTELCDTSAFRIKVTEINWFFQFLLR
jgi:hypothetical protein